MHKKTKVLISLALSTMLTSQCIVFASTVKASNTINETSYTSSSNSSLGGFELSSKKWVSDLNCNSYIYTHKKSGARLIYLETNTEEKTMCVNFRTPVTDDTGVNHIIEHSVLCGSKNYPVKDPFIQMKRQSLSTFLNAMTSNDSTMYPVSSKNEKDFENLMSVYLDAIFYPNMIKDKRIFNQEGWRYELSSQDAQLKYNGIVYNEMKGAYSSPETILQRTKLKSLFPDTSYKYESGGLPDAIPNLTYDKFVETYNRYYVPSNSYFFLCGKVDIEKELKFIGEKYLNSFDKREVNTSLEVQQPFKERKEMAAEYSISKDDSTDNKTYLSLNYVLDKSTNKDLALSFSLLQQLLVGTPSSPLYKAMKDNGFGENVSVQLDNSSAQLVLSITANNSNENQKEKFQKVVEDTLKQVVEKGFDKNLLNSLTSVFELSNRMPKTDLGLGYNNLIMRSWLYDGDPTLYLNINSDLNKIKDKLNTTYMQDLIKEYILNNKHSSIVVLKPVQGLEEKKEADLKENLAKYKTSLSKENINKLAKDTVDLKVWQDTPDTKENLNTLPSLTRSDISKDVKEYKTIEKNENGSKVLFHPTFTNGIDYVALYFDSSKVSQDKLCYVQLLTSLLGSTDTSNYTKEKLIEEIMYNSGGVSFTNNCIAKFKDNDIYYPKLQVNLVCLDEKLSKNFDIVKEIMYKTNLDDKQRLKEVIHNTKMLLDQILAASESGIAAERVSAYMSESGKYNQYMSEEFRKLVNDLDANFDSKSDEVIKNLKEVRDLVFNKEDMIASFTGNEENYTKFAQAFNDFSKDLLNKNLTSCDYKFDSSKINEGIITPSKVQYVVKGGSFKNIGFQSTGSMMVLRNILENDYLWNNIRVKGGAYGTSVASSDCNLILSSFRDPNLKETIDTFNNIPKYLETFNPDEKEMDNYVIGTIGQMDSAYNFLSKLLGPAADGAMGDGFYLTGTKQEDLKKEREELINTKAEDIRNLAPTVEELLKQNYLCVVGGETKIQENKKNFMTIKDLMSSKEEQGKIIDMDNKEINDEKKEWTIKFSTDVNSITVNLANVYVLDEQNHKVEVKVVYDKENNTIRITPETKYDKGKKYTLFIKDIESLNGEKGVLKLLAPMKMEFTIKK